MSNTYPEISFSKIIDTLGNYCAKTRIEIFWSELMSYLRQKYPLDSDKRRIARFKNDYYAAILANNADSDDDVLRKKWRLNRMIQRWAKAEIDYIKRESIIATAFALKYAGSQSNSEKSLEDGECIANQLLLSIGYPKLSPSSETEIIYIYALNNSKSYAECIDLYNSYTAFKMGKKPNQTGDKKSESTTFYANYFNFKDIGQQELYEKIWERSWDLRNGSKLMTDYFVQTFSEEAKKSGVLQSAALFYLMFAGKTKDEKTFNEALSASKCFCKEDNEIWNVDYLSRWLFDQKCEHKIIRNTFDSFYSAISKLKPEDGLVSEKYISREGFIMWMLFCGATYEEINAKLARRFGTLQFEYYFDRIVTMIASFRLDNGCIRYYDRENAKEYTVIQGEDWKIQTKNERCLRASVANVLLDSFPEHMMLYSILATEKSITFEIPSKKDIKND